MLFPAAWLPTARAAIARAPETLWLTRAWDLTEESTRVFHAVHGGQADDAWLTSTGQEHPTVGQGGGMIVPARWFWDVGGFDEFYQVWGGEDNDLVLRARWDGRRVEWLPETHVVHQFHPRDWPTPEQFAQVQRNRDYLAARMREQGPIRRNPNLPRVRPPLAEVWGNGL
jgi:GT2 family glycosyltransferase